MQGGVVKLVKSLVVFAAAFVAAWPAWAAPMDWPTKTVTVIAPFPAGGTVDIVARAIGQKLGTELHQTFIVDNRGGAGGSLGTGIMTKAAPDGYTIMVNHMGLAFNASLYPTLPYDTLRDVLPVAYVGATPNVLVVPVNFPAKNAEEFLAMARAKPGTINFGSGGVGSAGHLPIELLQSATGVQLVHVPYKGNGPALVDLISGQIQVMLATIPAVMPHIKSGQLRALATSGSRRSVALPDVPTLDEVGVKGFDYQPWYGVFAPGATPPAIADNLHDAVNVALRDPVIARKLESEGLDVRPMTRQQFTEIVQGDVKKWAGIIRTLGIKGGQ